MPILAYLAVVAAGVTTSPLGIGALRARPDHPLGMMLGGARPIRTDEWLTEGPVELGVTVSVQTVGVIVALGCFPIFHPPACR